jgi:hypothetical protein
MVPGTFDPLKVKFAAFSLQKVRLEFGVTVGIGLTKMENERDVPEQLLDIGVTVITLTTGTKKLLFVVNAIIFPVPERAVRPVAILVLVQL